MKQFSAKKPHYTILNFKGNLTILKGVVIFLLFISAGATARTNDGITAPGKTNSVNAPSCVAAFTDSTSDRVAYFTSTSTDTNASTEYRWNFGDGGISHQVNPVHRYATGGSYTVCLTIKNTALSCADSVCHTVTITQCQAAFDTIVTGNLLTVTSTSTGVDANTTYTWNFGDGGIGHQASQTHTYTTGGTYDVCLTITNTNTGCSSEYCENVTTLPFVSNCTAAFSSSTDALRANFTNASTGTTINTTYTWNFGDGGISHQTNPTHLYGSAGSYTACLTIQNIASGCSDSVCHTVTVTQCAASFDTTANGNQITVTSTSTGVDANTVYDWSFGDGGIGHSATQSHTYATSGTYNVCLTISNTATGCSNTFCENVSTVNLTSTCQAVFTYTTDNLVANFTSTSTDTNANTKYTWSFGDGVISHQINPTHRYTGGAGAYTACLSIQNIATGCSDSVCHTVNITQCQASFDTSVNVNQITVTSTSTGVYPNTVYDWSFGDGGIGHQASQSHTYATPGTYNVCLTISNTTTGCSSTFCENVTTLPFVSTCTASFDTSVTGNLLTVTSTSTGVNGSTVYDWNFGDDSIGHQPSQSHTYATAGTYTVCLTISNHATGCYSQVCENVTTLPFVSSCTAAFIYTTDDLVANFTSTSTDTNANTKYTWSFGDGVISHQINPTHRYTGGAGAYTACLSIQNLATGCSDSICQTVNITQCQASFDTSVNVNQLTVTSTSTGVDANTVYTWNFGDGGIGHSATQSHTYATAATYDVCLIISNTATGCIDTSCENVTTLPFVSTCTASFDTSVTGNLLTVTSTSTGVNGSTVYDWDFGDGGIGHQASQSHTYATAGTYNVCLTISNHATGCYSKFCENVTTVPFVSTCTATFSSSTDDLVANFTNASTGTNGSTTYKWNFGDGGTSNQMNPTHRYIGGAGTYTACLTIKNAATGCYDSVCHDVTITQCQASFDTSVTGNLLTVSSTSTGVDANTVYDWSFGDGGIGHQATQSHTYKTSGAYNVCLTISNTATGCSSTFCENVTTAPFVSTCQASFDTSVSYRTVTLTSTSTGTNVNTKYDWSFGDGGISHQQNPTHTYPTKGICSVGIQLVNNQSSATPTGFQQQVIVNSSLYSTSESAGLQNVEFTAGGAAGQGGTALDAWLESGDSSTSTNSIWWVNLGNNVVPANGNLTIYINFLGTNVMSATGVTGEAPQLSTNYGQFDNGALVFPFYDNFAGTTLSNNWTRYDSGTGTIVVDNGITFTSEDVDPQAANIITSVNSYPANIVAEVYETTPPIVGGGRSYQPGLISQTAANEGVYILDAPFSTGDDGGGANPTAYAAFSNGRSSAGEYAYLQGTPSSPNPYADYDDYDGNDSYPGYNVWSVVYTGSVNWLFENYNDLADANPTYSPTGNLYFALGTAEYGAPDTYTFSAYWARTRAAAPFNAMPSANFGSLTCQAAPNKYDVCLTISNLATGCYSTTCDSVTLLPFVSTCQAAFTYTDTNLVAVFANTSTGTDVNTTYHWNFGDGGISHEQNPTHHYSSGGTYTACLTIQNLATGCFDSICQSVILTQCQASFDTSVNGRVVTFTSTSTDTTDSTHYFWSFGDGGISHQQNPTHTYKDSAKSVCFTMISVSNSQGTATPTDFQQQVVVNSSTYSASELVGLQNVEFTVGGPAGAGTVLNAWLESGDTNTSTNTVWWVNMGNTIIPANGSITLYMNFMNSAVMSASGVTGEAPELSTNYGQFDNGASVFPFYDNFAGTTLSGNWSTPYASGTGTLVVDNGLTITSEYTDAQAANVISSVNSFSPNVIAETYAGNFNSPISGTRSYSPGLISESAAAEGVIIVDQNWPSPPNDSYVCYSNGRAFGQYTFLQGTPTSPSPYADYNEGNPPNPPTGNNILGLVYTGSTNSLYVDYTDVADGNSSWSPSGNLYFALGIAEYGAGSASTFTSYWARTRQDPPNGVMPGTNAASLSCEPPGTYDVCLTISNSVTGCSSQYCENVEVTPAVNVCGADFTSSSNGTLAHFTSTSTDTTLATQYHWSFGDGGISHQMNPQHTYTATGKYDVCLTITDATLSFCDSTFCDSITITNGVSVCGANFTETSNGTLANFTSTSTDTTTATRYHWSFGDGSISHQVNPQHTYSKVGKYDVCLTITDSTESFCDSTFCDSITLTAPVSVCSPDFTFTANKLKVNFTSTSSDTTNATEYRWHFGDDSISHQRNPLHTYKQGGTYTVCLTLLDSTLSYCDSTICKDVTVSSPTSECTAHFTWVNVKGQGVHFYSDSKDTSAATKYSWNLGDGTVLQNEVDPSHRYAGSGDYYVCLTITDSTETYCNSTFCDSVDFVMTGINDLSFPGTSLYYDEASSQLVLNWVGNDNVAIHLVDILGRDAQDIYMGNLSTGTYHFTVNSANVASGIYFVHITAADGDKAWKIFVLPH